MPRKIDKLCPEKPAMTVDSEQALDSRFPGSTVRTYSFKTITAMFGGGVRTGEPDPVTPIRTSSVRGHLRFWWRATRGRAIESVEELRKRESEIWGDTDSPSPVQVKIKVNDKPVARPCAEYEQRDNNRYRLVWSNPFDRMESPLLYALFPFQGTPPDSKTPKSPANFYETVDFELTVIFPDGDPELQKDIDASVWAWANFGGIGARPRRGCGSLFCRELAPDSEQSVNEWFHGKMDQFDLNDGSNLMLTALLEPPLVQLKSYPPADAWAEALRVLRTFRQEGTGRKARPKPGNMNANNKPGRSYWPEPETIREVTRQRDKKHEKLDMPAGAYPRAEFGLPIVFHFPPRRDPEGRRDPEETQLYPSGKNRMASPLIIKPLAIGDGSKAVPMILRMSSEGLEKVELRKGSRTIHESDKIRGPEMSAYNNSPMAGSDPGKPPRSQAGSAVEAFLAFAEENGFERVTK